MHQPENLRIFLQTAFFVVAVSTWSSCDSRDTPHQDSSTADASYDAAVAADTQVCVAAGNTCVPATTPGCNGYEPVGTCEDGASACCPGHAFGCGERHRASGNTCDTAVDGYCGGTNSTPNCGSYACKGGCTCYNGPGGCDCPRCQRAAKQTGPLGNIFPSNGVLYTCFLALTPDAGQSDFPADAGACTFDNGDLCCEQ